MSDTTVKPDAVETEVEVLIKDLGVKFEETIKKVTDIESAVADQKEAVTLDIDARVKEYEAALDEVKEHVSEKIRTALKDRKGTNIGAAATEPQIIRKGKFSGKDIEHVVVAHKLLSQMVALKQTHKAHLSQFNVDAPSEEMSQLVKAYTEEGSGTGDEYVPTHMTDQMWLDFFTQSRVLPQFTAIDMPTNPYEIPVDFAPANFVKGTENTAPSDDDAATRKSTLAATELVALKRWSYSLNETSIVAIMSALQRGIVRDGAKFMDRFIMNADATSGATGNINLDDATPGATSYYLRESNGEDGLRHLPLVDNTDQGKDAGGSLTSAILLDGLANLNEYGVDVNNVVTFPGIKTYLKSVRGLSEVITLDKFGTNATIKTGQVASLQGSAVIPTESVALTEADGKVSTTASNNTKGQIVFAHSGMWIVGFVRRFLLEMDVDITTRQFILVASFRIAQASLGTRSSAEHTSNIYNITL